MLWLAALLMPLLHADDWPCRETATLWQGTSILSCGVAQAPTEAEARDSALENAYRELKTVCRISGRCRVADLKVRPVRTECVRGPQTTTCYRGLRATWVTAQPGRSEVPPPQDEDRAPELIRRHLEEQTRTLNQLHAITESLADEMSRSFFR